MSYIGAPYNFVPLPGNAIEANLPPNASLYQEGLCSGYIDCTLTTLTPLYIRSSLTQLEYEEAVEQERGKDQEERKAKPKTAFFSPGGDLRIPGSSLRGMIRTLVEIVANSYVEDVSRGRLFFRGVGGQVAQSMVGLYRKRMVLEGDLRTIQVGYMVKQGSAYSIYPAKILPTYETDFFRVQNGTLSRLFNHTSGPPQWRREKVWYLPPSSSEDRVVKQVQLQENFTPGSADIGWLKGWVIASGYIPKKNKNWLITEPDFTQKPLLVLDEDLLSYRDSGGITPANRWLSVLPEKTDFENALPCFYVKEDTKVTFGHTAYFRLPYDTTPYQAVPEELRNREKNLDLVSSLFGTAAGERNGAAGRVFFEDAFLTSPNTSEQSLWATVETPLILSNPKPTTFQHYLEQPNSARQTNEIERKRNLKHWGSDTVQIRGYKLYWHRRENEQDTYWINTGTIKDKDTQHTSIRPIKSEVSFKLRLRYENLNPVELGVLLTVLQLPDNCAHKLGMGKPLGMGSIRLSNFEVCVINRRERYRKLFTSDNSGWEIQTRLLSSNELQEYKKKFAGWVLNKKCEPDELWRNPRMQELQALLTFEGKPHFKDTRYMEIEHREEGNQGWKINEYKDRPLLPYPTRIINRVTGKVESAVTNILPRESTNKPTPPFLGVPAAITGNPQIQQLLVEINQTTGSAIRSLANGWWGQARSQPREVRTLLATTIKKKLVEAGILEKWQDRPWVQEIIAGAE